MSLLYSAAATATVAANTNSITIAGMDLGAVLPGMVINLGARDRVAGDGYIVATIAPTGTSGGTLTTVGAIPAAFNNAGFVIDTRDFNGTAPNYLISTYTQVLNALLRLTSPLTNLFTGSRQVALDKDSPGAVSRLLYAISGRIWGGVEQRTLVYTPTGGAPLTTETIVLRAYPDGTTPSDAVTIDLVAGAADVRKSSAAMVAAPAVDLGSAPAGKITLTGAVPIYAFGLGRHLDRLVHVIDGGALLVHHPVSLALPGGANILTAAGDCFHATSDASGNWRVRSYTRASGKSLIGTTAAELGLTSPSYRNRIINGGFTVNQRLVGGASQAYPAGTYLFDRWKAGPNGVTMSYAITGVGIVLTISAGSLVQIVEGAVYLTEGGSYVLSWFGTAPARIYQGTAGAYAAAPIVVGLGGSTNVTVEFGVGTVGLVQFEPGTVPTLFERRDDELQRCLRYYQPLGNWTGAVQENSPTTAFIYGKYEKMRAPPTAALLNPSGYLGRPNVAAISPTGIALLGLSADGGYIGLTVPSQANGVFVGVNTSNGIMLSAEL